MLLIECAAALLERHKDVALKFPNKSAAADAEFLLLDARSIFTKVSSSVDDEAEKKSLFSEQQRSLAL